MIDKTELLRMIMENNAGQSPEFIMEQYKTYLNGLEELKTVPACPTVDAGVAVKTEEEVAQDALAVRKKNKESLTCGYTKRSLKVKPGEAIQEDKIFCCICGKECQTLTERHLATHNGLSREGYIKLCGYPKDQSLISIRHLARMKSNVMKAQAARKAKKLANAD